MADTTADDDFYEDPQTIGDTDDEVNGQPDEVPPSEPDDLSESIYEPEKHTTEKDTRGQIDELEMSDVKDSEGAVHDIDPSLLDDGPSTQDGDDWRSNTEQNPDEQDGTER